MTKRLFLAFNLPLELKKRLKKVQDEITQIFPAELLRMSIIKWVEPENLHLTLLFLGTVAEKNIPNLENSVKEAIQSCSKISLFTTTIQYGPPKIIPPRLIWLHTKQNPVLDLMVDKLKKAAKTTLPFWRPENRVFTSHITLARLKSWLFTKFDFEEIPELNLSFETEINFSSIELMESILKRSGPEYRILHSFLLK